MKCIMSHCTLEALACNAGGKHVFCATCSELWFKSWEGARARSAVMDYVNRIEKELREAEKAAAQLEFQLTQGGIENGKDQTSGGAQQQKEDGNPGSTTSNGVAST
jgi:hypothetical protein